LILALAISVVIARRAIVTLNGASEADFIKVNAGLWKENTQKKAGPRGKIIAGAGVIFSVGKAADGIAVIGAVHLVHRFLCQAKTPPRERDKAQ
jgi:hypothetical protein